MSDANDHDRLIRIETKLNILIEHFDNHLKHHWAISIPLVLVAIGLIIKLII